MKRATRSTGSDVSAGSRDVVFVFIVSEHVTNCDMSAVANLTTTGFAALSASFQPAEHITNCDMFAAVNSPARLTNHKL
jgi:hypothetical protein